MQLETWADWSRPDIVASGFDAGIGPKRWVASDMIGVRVTGPMKIAIVGAPTYFAGRRPPRTPDDLTSHNCIQYRLGAKGPLFKWQFEQNGKARQIAIAGRLCVNTPELAIRAVLDGLGVAYLPEELAAPFLRTGQLIRVLKVARLGGKPVSLLPRTPAGSDHATRVHRHGPRPEINSRQALSQNSLL